MTEPTTALCRCSARTEPHQQGETPCVYTIGSVLGEWADDDELRAHLVSDHGFSASILLGHGSPGLRHVHRYEHRWELDD